MNDNPNDSPLKWHYKSCDFDFWIVFLFSYFLIHLFGAIINPRTLTIAIRVIKYAQLKAIHLHTKSQRTFSLIDYSKELAAEEKKRENVRTLAFSDSMFMFVCPKTFPRNITFGFFFINLATRPYMDMGRFQFFIVPPLLRMVNAFSPNKWNGRFWPANKLMLCTHSFQVFARARVRLGPSSASKCIQIIYLIIMTIVILPSK